MRAEAVRGLSARSAFFSRRRWCPRVRHSSARMVSCRFAGQRQGLHSRSGPMRARKPAWRVAVLAAEKEGLLSSGKRARVSFFDAKTGWLFLHANRTIGAHSAKLGYLTAGSAVVDV